MRMGRDLRKGRDKEKGYDKTRKRGDDRREGLEIRNVQDRRKGCEVLHLLTSSKHIPSSTDICKLAIEA